MRSGGLTYYGGFLLALPVTVLYGVNKKVPIRLGMDIIAPCLMIGLGFGRIGCFLNGCCHGAECDLPWAVRFPYYSNAYIDQFADQERPCRCRRRWSRRQPETPDATTRPAGAPEGDGARSTSSWPATSTRGSVHPGRSSTVRSPRGCWRCCWWRTSRSRTCRAACLR